MKETEIKNKIRDILDEEIGASLCECVLGPHIELQGKEVAVNSLYELFISENTPEQTLSSGSDMADLFGEEE